MRLGVLLIPFACACQFVTGLADVEVGSGGGSGTTIGNASANSTSRSAGAQSGSTNSTPQSAVSGTSTAPSTSSTGSAGCAIDAPFEPAVRLASNINGTDTSEYHFHVSPNNLFAVFSSNSGSNVLRQTRRALPSLPWEPPFAIQGPQFNAADPMLASVDGTPTLFFWDESGLAGARVLKRVGWNVATSQPMGSEVVVAPRMLGPFFVSAAQELWAVLDNGAPPYRLMKSTYANGAFGPFALDPVLSTPYFQNSGVAFAQDGLTVWFGAQEVGSTHEDIYRATRPFVGAAFTAVTLVSELSSPAYDNPSSVSEDNCHLYFSSSRDGNIDVYEASRVPR